MESEKENVNTEYELLAQEIYKLLLKADGFEKVEVRHNVLLKGKSGCEHQIDVYWEFEVAGEIHRVAIECKNYTKTVSIGKVRDFFGVVHDIGNIKGIVVTKKGFQSGAKVFAEYYGISLKEMREPQKEDWTGRLKGFTIQINIMPKKITGISVELDWKWIIQNKLIESEAEKSKITIPVLGKLNAEVIIYDGLGNKLKDVLQLEEELPHEYKAGTDFKHAFKFDDGYMDSNIGRIKVNAVGMTYDIQSHSEELIIDAEEITKAIIKDVKTGNIKFIRNDGEVR